MNSRFQSRSLRMATGGFAGLILFRQQQPAEERLGAEHPQQAGLPAHPVDPLGLLAAGQRQAAALRQRHLLEGMVLVLDIDVLARRRPVAENADSRRMQPNGRQPVRVRIGQRTQQQRIHHAENGRIGADSDGQREPPSPASTPAFLRSVRKA